MPAVRRFTATRTWITAMMPNASAPAERNTNTLTMVAELSPPDICVMRSNRGVTDQILKLHILYIRTLPISIQPAAQPRPILVMSYCKMLM